MPKAGETRMRRKCASWRRWTFLECDPVLKLSAKETLQKRLCKPSSKARTLANQEMGRFSSNQWAKLFVLEQGKLDSPHCDSNACPRLIRHTLANACPQ